MEDFSITVKIADRSYKLKIQRAEEEIVRKAQSYLNDKVKEYSDNFAFQDKQDLIAMAALESVMHALRIEEKNNFEENEFDNRLEQIDDLLSDII